MYTLISTLIGIDYLTCHGFLLGALQREANRHFFSHQDSSLIYYFRGGQGSLINVVQPASNPGWKGRENENHCSALQMALTQGHEEKDALESSRLGETNFTYDE